MRFGTGHRFGAARGGGGNGGAAFNPYALPNLTVNLEASAAQLTLSTTSVDAWANQGSAAGYTGTTTTRPTWNAGGSYVAFDGTDDYLQGDTQSNVLGTGGYSVYAVAYTVAATTNTTTGWLNDTIVGDSSGNMAMGVTTAPALRASHYDGANKTATVARADGVFQLVEQHIYSGNLYAAVNGTVSAGTAVGAFAVAGDSQIGLNQTFASRAWNGRLKRLLVFKDGGHDPAGATAVAIRAALNAEYSLGF